jgi:ubiquinone/menaquinone biosynthesis C-methylase UbiE
MISRVLEPELMDTSEDALAYDAMDHNEPNQAFVERLLELGAHGEMLDVGTGPGHIPLLVCARISDGTVLGVDLARSMLALAERRRLASPHADRVRYELADAKKLPFADQSFDTVFSNTLLHHLPEPVHFLREAARVLRPGGALLIRDLFRPDSTERARELVARYAPGANETQQRLFYDSFCAALTPLELRAAATEAGLRRAAIVLDTDRHMSLQIASIREAA